MSTSVPASVLDLTNYVKARLGDDIHTIEMSATHYSIVIEDALERFYDKVYDGYEEDYITITMTTSNEYTLDNEILSVADVMGAWDYVQADLPFMVEGVGQITGNKKYSFEFSSVTHILKIFNYITVDTDMGLRVYKKFDATTYTDIYNHKWLKKYATALARRQWGDNISKYGSVILPGGMTLESDKILDRAMAEIEECEKDLDEEHSFKPLPQVL